MWQSKRVRYHSPERGKTDESEANSFDSGVDTSSLDNSFNSYSLAGRIECLHMINFMCHSNLEVTFNNRITFVTGHNGSGKSTIMTALIVVLGGSASITGRGHGMADLIKKGEKWGKVSVTLINEGVNPYKPEIYGNRITIIRDLATQGGTSYTCKSMSGAVISKKKEEVDKICTALDLQIKNPICVLNQDVARTFLSASDNSMRYDMFMKATHMENLKMIYAHVVESLCESEKEIETKKMCIHEANKEISQLREKLEYYASLEKYVNEKTSLENELLWSLVISEEECLKCLLENQLEIERKKSELDKSKANFGEVISRLENSIKEVDEKISNLGNNGDGNESKKRSLQSEIQNIEIQIDNAKERMKNLRLKSERQQSDIKSIKEHLKQSDEMVSQSHAENNRIKEEIKKLNENLSELRDRIETTQRDSDNGSKTKMQYTVALDNLNSDVKDLEREKAKILMEKERSANVGDDPLSKFGPFTSKLKQLIDEAAKKNQFHIKPIGPCGMYITLSGDSKWGRAVESVISGLMNTYCCDNQKDFQVLSRIMENVCQGRSPPVIISKFQNSRHNVTSKKVSVGGLNTVLDVLHISNDVVFNTLVDQIRPETMLLFETDAQASSLLSHIQNVPKNLRMGLTIESDQYYPAPNYRTYSGGRNKPLKYFDAPVKGKSDVEKFDMEAKKVQMRVKEKQMESLEINEKLRRVIEFLKKTENNLKLLKHEERKILTQLRNLNVEEETKPVPPKRVVLEEELAVLEKNEEETQAKMRKDETIIETFSKEKEDCVRKLEEITQMEKSKQSELKKLQEKLDDFKYKLTIERNKKNNLTTNYKEIEIESEKIIEEINSKKKSLEDKTKTAAEYHEERIETNRSPAQVQQLLQKCEKYLEAAEKNVESKETVITEFKSKNEKYKNIKAEIDSLEKVTEKLKKTALLKEERFNILLSHTASLVSFHFQACLQTRGYDGKLKFDFRKRTLELEIAKEGRARKDTKTLSGGERSYSMVSFILAIWRAVQMPFYFLDEFDVFMDKVNRKVIMDLLLEHGRNEGKKQFIFITPQDTSAIECSDAVSVFKMPDPRKTNS